MKSTNYIASLLMLLCAFSFYTCKQSGTDSILSLEDVINHQVGDNLSEIGYNVDVINLEAADSSLLPGNAHIVYISQNKDIYVSDGKQIYRFDKSGDFKNTIGRIGQGPMEYQAIHNVSFTDNDENVCIYVGNNVLLIYTVDGLPLKKSGII